MKNVSVGKTVDLFMADLTASASDKTRAWYASFLHDFRLFAGEQPLSKVTPSLVHKWISRKYGDNSPSTQHGAGRTVCRLCNWAVGEGLIDRSPLKRFRKTTPSGRELVLSGADYAALVRAARGPLRDVVKFLWHTGARPQELRAIEAAWIGDRKITFPMVKSKGKKKRRVVYLDPMAAGIAARLARQQPKGPIFRDPFGRPWGTPELSRAFKRLRRWADVPGVCAYTLRHTWITRKLEDGHSVTDVAAAAGNTPATIMRVYCHVAENEERILMIFEKRRAV